MELEYAPEGTERDDRQNRLAQSHRDLPEDAEFAGAVDLGAFVEPAGQRIEEPHDVAVAQTQSARGSERDLSWAAGYVSVRGAPMLS